MGSSFTFLNAFTMHVFAGCFLHFLSVAKLEFSRNTSHKIGVFVIFRKNLTLTLSLTIYAMIKKNTGNAVFK